MTGDFSLEQAVEYTERILKQLRLAGKLIKATFGSNPKEIWETQQALAGLTPAQIRDACWGYKAQKGSPLIHAKEA